MKTPRKSPPCPACQSDQTALIQYGFPAFGNKELMDEKDQGIIEFGGCIIGDDKPEFRCHVCRHAWGSDEPPFNILNPADYQRLFDTEDPNPLDAAYRATTFRVLADPTRGILFPMDIRIGEDNFELAVYLDVRRLRQWAFVTAWNPQSQSLPAAENEARHRALVQDTKNYLTLAGAGIPDAPDWAAEESLLIAGISLPEAEALGRKYGQAAIVVAGIGGVAELRYL